MATADDTNESLEFVLNRATDPSQKEQDFERIHEFCEKVNRELEGPLLSTRLIAHKIQSPQEKEALYALNTLEACVKSCGRYFHQEIGKFRFLNEIIKVVSPKYLGNRTSETVKKKCVEILYCWTKGLSHEPKIKEAYQMLKSQAIIKQDPVYMDKKGFDPFPKPQPRKADFEDDEKAKTLERLLQSKNPEDLQAANRLIKSMVKQDAEKTEKRSRRINELESVGNQVKLLTEMISHYTSNSSSEGDKDVMKDLYSNLEKQRPNLFRLASDTDEQDNEGINDILEANDSVTRVLTLYKQKIEGEAPVGDYSNEAKDSSLLDLGLGGSLNNPGAHASAVRGNQSSSALLENDFKSLGLGGMDDLGGIFSSVNTQQNQQQHVMSQPGVFPQTMAMPGIMQMPSQGQVAFHGLQSTQQTMPVAGMPPAYSAISHNLRPSSNPAPAMSNTNANGVFSNDGISLPDLDILDKSLKDYNLSKESFPVRTAFKPSLMPAKLPLNQMAANKAAAMTPAPAPVSATVANASVSQPQVFSLGPSLLPMSTTTTTTTPTSASSSPESKGDFTPMVGASPEPELLPLTDIFVPLEKIQPASDIPSVTMYDKNSLKIMIHFVKERPRPDVLTMVVSAISTNSNPVSNFIFQAAVPKLMKVKLQPPSASEFPPFNPILPPAAITQVMLVANPRKEKVRLKFKVCYTVNGEAISDVGDVDGIQVQ